MADEVRQFSAWLGGHRRGQLDEEVTAALAEVVTAVAAFSKPGHVTVRIDVTPSGRTLLITDKVTSRVPEADREASIYFPSAEGGLFRDDPYQGRLFERPIQADPVTGEVIRPAEEG